MGDIKSLINRSCGKCLRAMFDAEKKKEKKESKKEEIVTIIYIDHFNSDILWNKFREKNLNKMLKYKNSDNFNIEQSNLRIM